MNNTVGVGVVGIGRIGTIHAKNLAFAVPSAELKAIADTRTEVLDERAKECGSPDTYEDYGDLLARSDIAGVGVCTSTDTHARIVKDAAEAGKHVFCEKPIALDLDEIDGVLSAVEEAGIKFQVGFSRRFDPSFRRAKKKVEGGEIGQPHLLKLTSRDPEPPSMDYVKASGGLFVDMTTHDFDMARFIMDEEIEEVYAHGSVLIEEGIGEVGDVDTASVMLKFKSGAIGLIDNSRKATYGYDQRLEVLGSEGKIEVSNPRETKVEVSDDEGARRDPLSHFFTERYDDAYREEMAEYTKYLKEGGDSPASGEAGREAVVLAGAAEISRQEDRPVKLNEVS